MGNDDGRAAVALLAKVPVPGMVKTRLAETVGPKAAARLARAMLLDLVGEHQGREYDLIIACNVGHRERMKEVVRGVTIVEAEGTDLRGPESMLLRTFRELLRGYERAIVVCADTPFVDCDLAREALAALSNSDLVLGPGVTGGYYLIGMRQVVDVFSDHPAGRHPYLGRTLSIAEGMAIRYHLTCPKWDIDTVEDIRSAPWKKSKVSLRYSLEVLGGLGFDV